ncbi:putative poly(A) polymerase [Xylaria longipes]|nr:putative poly(A) polymerase [Xylaria longipes]
MEPQISETSDARLPSVRCQISIADLMTVERPPRGLKLDNAAPRQNKTIALLPAEELLRELLLGCRDDMLRSGISQAANLEIWIVGSWVRDRLLGVPCSAVDIVLSTVTGCQFGSYLTAFLNRNEASCRKRAAELKIPYSWLSSFQATKKDFGKSKALQIAVGRLSGLDLDLYGMEFGTLEEDAFRRDATVNALFFNLDSRQVLDPTKKGLDDMNACIIRTPLDPRQTFLDDPLRVLRLIRISSKLGYMIEHNTKALMKDDGIQEALEMKVSREQIGIEVAKIMRQPNPSLACRLLFEANLYTPVFLRPDPSILNAIQDKLPAGIRGPPWPPTWRLAYETLDLLVHRETSCFRDMIRCENPEDLWLMSAYAPIGGLRNGMLKNAVDEATGAIKATRDVSKLLYTSLRNLDSIRAVARCTGNFLEPPSRSTVGMAIRAWGSTWRSQVVYAFLAELVCETPSELPLGLVVPLKDNAIMGAIIAKYNAFADFVMANGLENADSLSPLLDDNEIMDLFGLENDGMFLKRTIEKLLEWQFNYKGMGPDDAAVWLLSRKEMLGIPSSS